MNKGVLLVNVSIILSMLFFGDNNRLCILCPVTACSWHSVDLQCYGRSCVTEEIKVSGDLCSNYFNLKVIECDMDLSYEELYVYVNGVYKGICDANHNDDDNWHNCGNYYHYSYESFKVKLDANYHVWQYCTNDAVVGAFTVYGRVMFQARHYTVNAPTVSPTDHPTFNPTQVPTQLPTSAPTWLPTIDPTSFPTEKPTKLPSVSPTVSPTASPCQDKYDYCFIASSEGLCWDEDHEIRNRVHDDCPVSCGTCFNSTLSPSSLPTLPPTVAPTSPTLNPTRKPTSLPTRNPTVAPTLSPTCIDSVGYCGSIASFCNSSSKATNDMMITDCASTCGYCSLEPTLTPTDMPTVQCVDAYSYCFDLAQTGSCYDEDLAVRYHFRTECPVSCDTCNDKTVRPTMFPSSQPTPQPTSPTPLPSQIPSTEPSSHPTQSPTIVSTCIDNVGYCDIIRSYCRNHDSNTIAKMVSDCSATCGFCTPQPSHYPSPFPSRTPTHKPSIQPIDFPTVGPTLAPTNGPSTTPPSSLPSGSPSFEPSTPPSMEPTQSPSTLPPTQCIDFFDFCNDLAEIGACYDDDRVARNQIQRDCPVSCSTCYDNTISPTSSPSIFPSVAPSEQPSVHPTEDPTPKPSEPKCDDDLLYCKRLTHWCNNTESLVKKHCTATCGFCTNTTTDSQKGASK